MTGSRSGHPPISGKTHTTAIVIIPPGSVQEPIQEIRRRHDRKMRRWMPHVTLIYPFRRPGEFDALEGPLAAACRAIEAFRLELSRFHHFRHGRGRFTLWLAPEPDGPLRDLQGVLEEVVPDCRDQSQHAGGFTPHLSVGQFRGPEPALLELERTLQERWTPIAFPVGQIEVIRRGEPPDDIFRIDRSIPLGAGA